MSEWIRVEDSEWTPEKLTAEIANRSLTREVEFGPLEIDVQPFQSKVGMPQPLNGRPYNADLFNHLRALNESLYFEMTPILERSQATRKSWISSIGKRVRGQLHNLVLFYINRASRQQSRVNEELIGTLNELTRAIEAQKEPPQSTAGNLSDQKERRKGA